MENYTCDVIDENGTMVTLNATLFTELQRERAGNFR